MIGWSTRTCAAHPTQLHNRPEIGAPAVVLATMACSSGGLFERLLAVKAPGQLGTHLRALQRAATVEDRRQRRAGEVKWAVLGKVGEEDGLPVTGLSSALYWCWRSNIHPRALKTVPKIDWHIYGQYDKYDKALQWRNNSLSINGLKELKMYMQINELPFFPKYKT